MTLSTSDALPRYKQIAYHIIDAIQTGHYLPGEKLPSENQLAAKHQVHRLTVRHAMNLLAQQGFIYRHQGKGSFVAEPNLYYAIGAKTSFSHAMLELGYLPCFKILSVKTRSATAELMEVLQIAAQVAVLEIKILRTATAAMVGPKVPAFQPLCISCSYLREDQFPQLSQKIYHTQSLYGLLKQHYGVVPQRRWTRVAAEAATPEDVALLDMPPQIPVLITQGLSQTDQGDLIDYTVTRFRSDRFILEIPSSDRYSRIQED
ncbi:GntR family transcriptional regulator [Synechococcus sp. PCC 6716]|nr:GntR family transcriptional regulator [Synechococcus sp. PCC 6716]